MLLNISEIIMIKKATMVNEVKKMFILLSKYNSLDSTAIFPHSSPTMISAANINMYNFLRVNLQYFLFDFYNFFLELVSKLE